MMFNMTDHFERANRYPEHVRYHRFDVKAWILLVLAAVIVLAAFTGGAYWAGQQRPIEPCDRGEVYVVNTNRCVLATDHAAHMEGTP
jgi:hypothetical protein